MNYIIRFLNFKSKEIEILYQSLSLLIGEIGESFEDLITNN